MWRGKDKERNMLLDLTLKDIDKRCKQRMFKRAYATKTNRKKRKSTILKYAKTICVAAFLCRRKNEKTKSTMTKQYSLFFFARFMANGQRKKRKSHFFRING
jgi:hypothetical protein